MLLGCYDCKRCWVTWAHLDYIRSEVDGKRKVIRIIRIGPEAYQLYKLLQFNKY